MVNEVGRPSIDLRKGRDDLVVVPVMTFVAVLTFVAFVIAVIS